MSGWMPGAERSPDLLERAQQLEPVVGERLAEIRSRIERAGGEPAQVRVVAVTKTFGPEAVLAALAAGIADIGENYADELLAKASAVADLTLTRANWHFIGSIQRNKVARLAATVSCWQTVSRAVEAQAIAARSGSSKPSAFIEVNVAGDPARPGCDPERAEELAQSVTASGLALRGLMAVAPGEGGRAEAERAFRKVADLAARLGLRELSTGMSGDLEAAVQAGTTMVRIGSALFGPRNPRAAR